MNSIRKRMALLGLIATLLACGGSPEKSSVAATSDQGSSVEDTATNLKKRAQEVKQELCSQFPQDLVLGYNPSAKKLEIEPIDDGNGGILDCKLKLFFGDKEHEFFEGLISASVSHNPERPFWQYDPSRNPNLYQTVDGVGEKAVYITNIRQLLVLKEGLIYYVAPPSNSYVADSGKETKQLAIEIAKHFNL
ncbi:MAG: hypothetical protein AAGH46_10745 [Bacteroidota bacterium]